MDFEWDPEKATRNIERHGVSFHEAATVFGDPLSVTVYDPDHSDDEDRYIIVGQSVRGRLLMVAHAERGSSIRIISSRPLTTAERVQHEAEN